MSAGQFMEVLLDEVGSIKLKESIYCVLHKEDEYPNIQHHHKIRGFPFSHYSCPRESQLVMSLINALLSGLDVNTDHGGGQGLDQVRILCFTIFPF
jgi:hypothetical protein